MPSPRLELPTIQNWSCHNCSGCCRQHVIEITDDERKRIESQGWTAKDGIPDGRTIETLSGGIGATRYRLAHQPDGACVFLGDDGLCRIHAKFGEAAKPLACQVYPYAFHPRGKSTAVSLRFSCPSVVRNLGTPLAEQKTSIGKIAQQVVPANVAKRPPPTIRPGQQLDWPDFLKFVNALDETLALTDVPVVVRLLRALFWLGLVEQATFDNVRGDRLSEFLEIVTEAAAAQFSGEMPEARQPSRSAAMQFRMLVAQYTRRDTAAEIGAGLGVRLQLLRWALRFAWGGGDVPPMQEGFRCVPFATLEQPFGELPEGGDELLTRYFRVKVAGIHFCGPAYYDISFVHGFRSLVLVYPAVLWTARWVAAGEGRNQLNLEDIVRAITVVDHHHGYSQALGTASARRRVELLGKINAVSDLCVWYSQ